MAFRSYKRKGDNPNPVPRVNLPDVEEIMARFKPELDKVCEDIKKNWWYMIIIPEIEDEIRQNVMLIFYTEWRRYCDGLTDRFPPKPGYFYISAFHMLEKQFAPHDDVYRHTRMLSYNTAECGTDKIRLTGNIIFTDPLYRLIATKQNNIPPFMGSSPELFYEHLVNEENAQKIYPDIVDFWFLGFTILQLANFYGVGAEVVRDRLHDYYDALEMSGHKLLRPRPIRRKRRLNHFKVLNRPKKVNKIAK